MLNNIRFRLAPRWGVCNGEGENDGPRCVPLFPPTGQSLNPQPEQLKGSKFDTPEDLAAFAQKFDEGVKRVFSSDKVSQYVKFGSPRDTDPKCGIKAGRLALTG